ncbi:MAG: proline--tRNA ligase [Nitrospirota bacterium]
MRYSRLLIPTLKENPSEAEAISHKLMVRAGLVRQLAAGLYIYLPLGLIILDKINRILREEMNAIGAQEISMPVLHPAEVWQQTGRWNEIGDEMFRLKDRGGRDMCLGMTHEEIMTWLASMEIRSYRDLPQIWYQIQTKLRDEARPKSGVLRTREFTMKDSYSFNADEEGLEKSYQLHLEAYKKIFERSGLKFYVVESDPGMMGGAVAHEFMAPSPAGEDEIVLCSCGYAANVELAKSVPTKPEFPVWKLEEIATPNSRTIDEVSEFLKLDKRLFIKSLILVSQKGPVMALVRGDLEAHEKKLRKIIGEFRPAHKEEVKESTGIEAGFIGPIRCKLRIIADETLQEGIYVTGANKEGYHIKGVVPKRDFTAEFADIHTAKAGDGCPKCGKALASEKVIEIGNIFKLGTKYSEPLKAYFLDENGKEKPIIMGSYGIGPARIAASAIEQNYDDNGIIWPLAISPFQVEILPLNMKNEAVKKSADEIYQGLLKENIEVLIDDREASPGIKFKDADLIGIPYRIIIGEKGLKEGLVEIKERRTGKVEKIKAESAIGHVKKVVKEAIS